MNGLIAGGLSLSPQFVERVAWVLLHTIWQFSVAALAAALVLQVVNHRKAATRYSVLVGLIVVAVVCPLVTWHFYSVPNQFESSSSASVTGAGRVLAEQPDHRDHLETVGGGDAAMMSQAIMNSADRTASVEDATAGETSRFAWIQQVHDQLRPYCKWIVGLWLTGVTLGSFRPLLGWMTLRRLARVAVAPASVEIRESLLRMSNQLGLRRKVRILESALADVPLVIGYVRPVILLPVSFVTGISPIQLDAVLAHELAHVRRHDFLVNLLQVLVETLFFYHPAIWWLSRQIRAEREHCCDDIAIAATNNRAEYGRALLAIEVGRKQRNTYALAASDGPMLTRIRRIVGVPQPRTDGSPWVLPAVVASLAGVSFAMAIIGDYSIAATDDVHSGDRPASISDIAELDSTARPPLPLPEKHPYCVVDVDNLKPRSLDSAIDDFNLAAQQSPIGMRQEPISMEETLGAIAVSIQRLETPDTTKQILRQIVASKELPSNVYFRRFTRFDDEEQMHGVWWVRLIVEGNQQPVYSVLIRKERIFSRPYTQMERQQIAQQGVTLINRFSSYFQAVPNVLLLAAFPEASIKKITDSVGSAIKAGDFDAFASSFEWKDVSETTRAFVKSEFDFLTKATVHSIKVTPRNFRGKLLHWSAFQSYESNLPIVGYVDIEYSATAGGRRRTLSLEMGNVDNELRLVNYVAKGPREFPKTLAEGLSIRGQSEQLADGTFLVTSIISNPGSLISAHLANEEIWQRDYSGKYDSDIKWIARQIATVSPAESWREYQCDDQPSVSINGRRGFRIVLRRTWKEYTSPAQQRSEVTPQFDAPFISHDVDWEFVLFPQQTGDVTADFKSRISWGDSKSPYF
ncbi:MAG: M56 family metallopeptidase, partial [Planctomycetales bacterium]|nr:M56 family metallopeptidase [Planctomycetales bacterium]